MQRTKPKGAKTDVGCGGFLLVTSHSTDSPFFFLFQPDQAHSTCLLDFFLITLEENCHFFKAFQTSHSI